MKQNINNRRLKPSARRRRAMIVVTALLLVLALVMIPIYAFADDADNSTSSLGLSTSTLGESTIYSIYSAQDLENAKQLGTDGENGKDYSKVILQIEADFTMADLQEWTPLGTQTAPFNGAVHGNNKTIGGVGSNGEETLLGYLKDATVQDLTVVTTKPSDDPNPYYGLLKSSENSTIINCHIQTLSPLAANSLRMLRSGIISSDTAWKANISAGGGSSSTPVIDTAGKLWAFAEMVTDGESNFHGDTVTINGTIDCQNQPFPGVGTKDNPFKGSIQGNSAIIKNLRIEGSGAEYAGLIAYADAGAPGLPELSTIEGVRLQDAFVVGNNSTGALLGYGKDVVVKNCSVSGQISGNADVGALVGKMDITVGSFLNNDSSADFMALPYIDTCYSTADVNASMTAGGLVGNLSADDDGGMRLYDLRTGQPDIIISNCFTTGTVVGNSQIGGIVGYLAGDGWAGNSFAVSESGSMSVVNANVNVGGLVGVAATEYSSGNGAPPVINSYFAGTVKGTNFAGGLVGTGGGAQDSYVSGKVISPLVFSAKAEASVWPTVGFDYAVDQPGVWAMPDTVHRPGDPTNSASDVASRWADYVLVPIYSSSISGDEHEPVFATVGHSYFTTGGVSVSGFTAGNITISGSSVTGTFPTLPASFTGASTAHSTFSDISTNAGVANFPSVLYINNSLEATQTSGGSGTAFVLPSVAGLSWQLDGGTTYEIADDTIPSGKNIIKIVGGKITATAPLKERLDVVITGEASGIAMKFVVTLIDEAARPVLADIPQEFVTDKTKATHELLLEANIFTLKFPEGIDGTPGNARLQVYSDKNFATPSGAPHANGATITRLSENIFKVTIDKTLLKSDQSYEIDFTGCGLEDLAGNPVKEKLYFKTISNSLPEITFDNTYDLYQQDNYKTNSTNANKDVQVVGMTENDENYNGYLDGVMVENPNGQVIDLEDPAFGGTYTIDTTSKPNMAGKDGYGSLTNPLTDFKKIPGEYSIKYQVPDPENTSVMSNVAERIYRVYSRTYFTRGKDAYTTLTATFTSNDMAKIQKDMQEKGLSINQAIENALNARYKNDASSADYLSAYRYSYDTTKETLPISFDTSALNDGALREGFKRQITLKAGDFEQVMVLDIHGTVVDYEIEVDAETFTTTNTLSRGEARRFFNAQVRQKSTGKIVDFPLTYSFKKVHSNNYNVPQVVTITMIHPSGVTEINGVDMTVTKNVSVVIVKENVYKHPEDVEDNVGIFWDKTTESVKASDASKVLDYNLTYDDASRTPADFFLVVKNRDGAVINMKLPTGIKLSFDADSIDKALTFKEGLNYNLAVEPMYDVYIARDAGGAPVQQFYTPDEFVLPGALQVEVPLSEGMPTKGLSLYRVDDATNRYVLITKISEEQATNGKITLEMKEFQGQYVITSADLKGKTVSK